MTVGDLIIERIRDEFTNDRITYKPNFLDMDTWTDALVAATANTKAEVWLGFTPGDDGVVRWFATQTIPLGRSIER